VLPLPISPQASPVHLWVSPATPLRDNLKNSGARILISKNIANENTYCNFTSISHSNDGITSNLTKSTRSSLER
jgi:hypothetical protein